jgi:hypothetical protein
MVWTPGQSIGLVKGPRFVDDAEVILGKKESPAVLAAGGLLFCSEVLEVIMVGPNFKDVRVAFEVVAEGFKGFDDGKEFFIVDVIIKLGRVEGLGVIGNGVPTVQEVWLFEDGTDGKVAGVGDDTKGLGEIRKGKDRSCGESMDEGAEGGFVV